MVVLQLQPLAIKERRNENEAKKKENRKKPNTRITNRPIKSKALFFIPLYSIIEFIVDIGSSQFYFILKLILLKGSVLARAS